jgi:hypothetical protein
VTKQFSGDIDGQSATEWLIAYAEDGSATFVGLERIRGTVGGRSGSFAVQHVGTFEEGAARAALPIAPGSGTDELRSIAGHGSFVANPGCTVTLERPVGRRTPPSDAPLTEIITDHHRLRRT